MDFAKFLTTITGGGHQGPQPVAGGSGSTSVQAAGYY